MASTIPSVPRLTRRPLANQQGLTLLEVMLAAVILLFVLFSMISGYSMGRVNLDREEVKRRAVALAQDRMETMRARSNAPPVTANFNKLQPSAIDTSYTVDGNVFTLVSGVTYLPPGSDRFSATLDLITMDVSWTVYKKAGTATRSIRIAGAIARDLSP